MANKSKKRMSPIALIVISLCMIIITVCATLYLGYKEKYAGQYLAYSKEQIKNLPDSGIENMMAKLFYSDEEISAIQNQEKIVPALDTTEVDSDGIEIDYLNGPTYQATMMIVHNPEDVVIGVNPNLDSAGAGPTLEEYIDLYDGVAGMNAGGFEDAGGNGNGGQAWGIVIENGELVSGSLNDYTTVIGITYDNKLVCRDMSAQQALDWGLRDAITFGPVFIYQFENVFTTGRHPMLNPRTVIGQREDGAFLLLVIDGRQPISFGSTYPDIIQIMQDYGAMTAGNLDGGNSSVIMYEGQEINSTVSLYGARNLPTAIIVKGDK